MIRVFTLNKNNKIELTKEELQKLLDESYWDGYRANDHSWTYNSPSLTVSSPYVKTTETITVSNEGTASNTITDIGVENGKE